MTLRGSPDSKYVSPLDGLIKQSTNEGHDVEGAAIEIAALREAAKF